MSAGKTTVKGNPYPKDIVDEASGVSVPNDKWEAWQAGYTNGLLQAAFSVLNNIFHHVEE
ncbi:MAG: hypothetical protein PHI12_07575 [Dehalococcoidales bacterium]|nr:hypothetical protein [Dehalococcoidales bacterium]